MCRCFALIALVMILAGAPAAVADKLTEENMTQRDFKNITETESSVAGEKPTDAPRSRKPRCAPRAA